MLRSHKKNIYIYIVRTNLFLHPCKNFNSIYCVIYLYRSKKLIKACLFKQLKKYTRKTWQRLTSDIRLDYGLLHPVTHVMIEYMCL